MTDPARADRREAESERPPVGGRWGALYAVVVAALVVEIALLAWLTEAFR